MVKCPTLKDIRQITYDAFVMYINLLYMTKDTYLNVNAPQIKYNELNQDEQVFYSLYYLLLYGHTWILEEFLGFFILGNVVTNRESKEFDVYEYGSDKIIGHVNNDNFELLRDELKCILGVTQPDPKDIKFKNDYAKDLYNRMKEKNSSKQIKKANNEDYELDNMIRKYCTHNKVGINILNVWDMTYYQFITMFYEFCNGRQYDFNDRMAANTFSYKKASDYKPMDYMKKIK